MDCESISPVEEGIGRGGSVRLSDMNENEIIHQPRIKLGKRRRERRLQR